MCLPCMVADRLPTIFKEKMDSITHRPTNGLGPFDHDVSEGRKPGNPKARFIFIFEVFKIKVEISLESFSNDSGFRVAILPICDAVRRKPASSSWSNTNGFRTKPFEKKKVSAA